MTTYNKNKKEMDFYLPTNRQSFTLEVDIVTSSPQDIRLLAMDTQKPSTYYIYQRGVVDGKRTFYMKFPQSPPTLVISIFNLKKGNFRDVSVMVDGNKKTVFNEKDPSFKITRLELTPCRKIPFAATPDTLSFLKFAQEFAENASILQAGNRNPMLYTSDDGKFEITYSDVIRNRRTGAYLSTPARIGHDSGRIDVSKNSFLNYTVPMRVLVLLHEYAHKWLNPSIGRQIGYESGADINALEIFLSEGYPYMEANYAFTNIFDSKTANNPGNVKRLEFIKNYIRTFATEKNKFLAKAA